MTRMATDGLNKNQNKGKDGNCAGSLSCEQNVDNQPWPDPRTSHTAHPPPHRAPMHAWYSPSPGLLSFPPVPPHTPTHESIG